MAEEGRAEVGAAPRQAVVGVDPTGAALEGEVVAEEAVEAGLLGQPSCRG